MGKIYRTMQGKQIDIDAFLSRNEMTQAVGNMNVNARGDVLGVGGKIVKTREQVMSEYYRDNPKAVKDNPAHQNSLTPDQPQVDFAAMPKEAVEFDMEDQEIEKIKKSYSRKGKE
jgi:uncharacterized protein YdcH (DUF465 family)